MLRHQLLLIYRNFKKYKVTFFINLIGLSSGLACALLIYLWVGDELGRDKFHEHDSRLHQVMTRFQSGEGIGVGTETAPVLAEILMAEMPEVNLAISEVINNDSNKLLVDGKFFEGTVAYLSPEFFQVFSYPLHQGNENQVLADKSNIIISKELAHKLFSTSEGLIGEEIQIDGKGLYHISGIFSIPSKSSRKFDFALPLQTAYDHYPNLKNNWSNSWVNTYVLLNEAADLANFNHKIKGLIQQKTGQDNISLFTRGYSSAYLYNKYENGIQSGGRIEYVRLFSIIALFILLIACINFMNLSTANASRKFKEVGIKKAVGAGRNTLAAQFLGESMMMAFIALFLSLTLVWLILPQFNMLTAKQLHLDLDVNHLWVLLAITTFTGLISGSYPAIYLSGYQGMEVFKGKFNITGAESGIRKGLIIFQFVMSVILIVAVVVVYQQTLLIQNKNLGYNKDHVVFFQMEGSVKNQLETFLSEVKQIPGVIDASSMLHSFFGNLNSTEDVSWQGKRLGSHVTMEYRRVNYGMTELLEIEMAAGRSFLQTHSDTARIIFNESAIQAMGLQDPIGKTIRLWNREMEIIGVAKDFHFQTLHETVKPLFFFLHPERTNNVFLKLEAGREKETLSALQDFYQTYNPGYGFDYQFLDQEYQEQYVAEQRVSVLSKYFGGLTILISCLGLFGLSAFTAERRTKEIGIRKTLGATGMEIVKMLSGEFIKLVGAAILIALPIGYFFTYKWLENFAFRIELEWWFFIAAGLLTMAIALMTVSFQTFKAAWMNPVNALRSE
jgi:predicted permease